MGGDTATPPWVWGPHCAVCHRGAAVGPKCSVVVWDGWHGVMWGRGDRGDTCHPLVLRVIHGTCEVPRGPGGQKNEHPNDPKGQGTRGTRGTNGTRGMSIPVTPRDQGTRGHGVTLPWALPAPQPHRVALMPLGPHFGVHLLGWGR